MQNKEEEAEGGEEYAAYHQGAGHKEAHTEVQLVQPLGGERSGGESATTTNSSAVPLCKAGVEGPRTLTVTDSSSPKRCASGIEDPEGVPVCGYIASYEALKSK
jgi:hypothetical protein